MANYMEDIAKLLGVELGERFQLYDELREYTYDYYLTERGIKIDANDRTCSSTDLLCGILYGDYHIKRKPWKPKTDEFYWIVKPDGEVGYMRWYDSYSDATLYKIGNCYRYKVEADANLDKWILFYASDEILEV